MPRASNSGGHWRSRERRDVDGRSRCRIWRGLRLSRADSSALRVHAAGRPTGSRDGESGKADIYVFYFIRNL